MAGYLVLIGDATYLYIAGGGTNENVIKKVDGSGAMSVNATYTLTLGRKIRGIAESGDQIYVTCEEDEGGVAEPKVIKLDKDTLGANETELILPNINSDVPEEIGPCLVDGTDLYIGGSVTSSKDAAVWVIALGTFTVSDSEKHTTFQSNRVYEDFQGFTIVDPDSRFIRWHHNCVEFQAEKDETSYLTYDFTVAHFDDFTHKFKVIVEATPADGSKGYIWMIATALGNAKALDDANENYLGVFFERSGSDYKFILEECNAGALGSDTYTGTSSVVGEDYYFAVTKSGTSLTCEIYSTQALLDIGGAGDVDTLSLTITDNTFQYLYAGNTYNDTTDVAVTMDIENFVIGETTHNGKIETLYIDSTYVYGLTENGMILKITKSDLSLNSSAFIIPSGSIHTISPTVYYHSGAGAIYFVTECSLKHLLKVIVANLGFEEILADTDPDWTAFSSGYGSGLYLYIGHSNTIAGGQEIKKIDLSTMSVTSTLTLSTGTNGINRIWISPS